MLAILNHFRSRILLFIFISVYRRLHFISVVNNYVNLVLLSSVRVVGYIGSFVVLKLIQAGFQVVIIDNFHNSFTQLLVQLRSYLGTTLFNSSIHVIEADINDHLYCYTKITDLGFSEIQAAVHFAGLKSVPLSFIYPDQYWYVNVSGTEAFINLVQSLKIRNFIFSSSCTVYEASNDGLYDEFFCTGAILNVW